jgi:hypothetical protein
MKTEPLLLLPGDLVIVSEHFMKVFNPLFHPNEDLGVVVKRRLEYSDPVYQVYWSKPISLQDSGPEKDFYIHNLEKIVQ